MSLRTSSSTPTRRITCDRWLMIACRNMEVCVAIQRHYADGAAQDGLEVRELQRRDQLLALAPDAGIFRELRHKSIDASAFGTRRRS